MALAVDERYRNIPNYVAGGYGDSALGQAIASEDVKRTKTGVIISASTSTEDGAEYQLFPQQPAYEMDIQNPTGNPDIEYIRNGSGESFPIYAGTGRVVTGISNSAQISIRRIDQSLTPVTIKAEVFN